MIKASQSNTGRKNTNATQLKANKPRTRNNRKRSLNKQ